MWLWDRFIESLTYVGLFIKALTNVRKDFVVDKSYLASLQIPAFKPPTLYSRYDADPQTWINEQPPAKLFQHNPALSLLEPTDSEYHELSKKRKQEHLKAFNKKPQKCAKLTGISNELINQMIEAMANDPKGPFVIPMIIDHWTTVDNFKSILKENAFLGNQSLTRNNIAFQRNALNPCDVRNGDGDVICFASGGFVDYNAVQGLDRIRVRIDVSKLKNVKYNTFFKAVDLCVGCFSTEIQVTKDLKVKINHLHESKLQFDFILEEEKKTYTTSSELVKDELIFYGNILEINRIALLLPFIALEKGMNKVAIKAIYKYLNTLGKPILRKLMIGLSQNATMYSEFNVFSKLSLTPHLIYDIHFVREKETYSLHNLSEEEYVSTLSNIINAKQDVTTKTAKVEEAIEIVSNQRIVTLLYGRWIKGEQAKHAEQVDITNIPFELFEGSYVETRPGIRKVY